MSSIYENQWRAALSGASVTPSDSLWDNIAAEMDAERGTHNWITILLIAATVTVAFAFPLTVGNSSFEAKPEEYNEFVQSTIQNDNQLTETTVDDSAELQMSIENNTLVQTEVDIEKNSNTDLTVQKGDYLSGDSGIAKTDITEQHNDSKGLVFDSADPGRLGLDDIEDLAYIEPFDIDNYYLLPFYITHQQENERGLIAMLNLGRGSASGNNSPPGFGGFLAMDAAFETTPGNLTNGSNFTDDRFENDGTTSYLGAGIELPLGDKWSLLGSIGYLAQRAGGRSNIVIDDGIEYRPIGAYDPINPGAVFLTDSYEYTVVNSFLNIPVTVKYPIINKKIKLRGGLGLSTDLMLDHRVNSEEYGNGSYKPVSMDYKPVVLSGMINLDLQYDLTKFYGVAFEMGVRKGITSIDKDQQFYPSSFTLGLVLYYKIQ